ncbi:MAG: DUF4400 domain-containing protein [Gammaproteobacteria bacterium]|nr:DUF4400 domain-containing protein [Gammaproteobacteria bacterium]
MPNQQRLTGLLWLGKWFLLITLLVLIVDLFCVFLLWSPDGVWRLQNVLNKEVALLGLPQSDNDFLAGVIKSFYDTVFVSSGIDGMMRHAASLPPAEESQQTAIDFTEALRPVIETAMVGLQLFALRVGILILTLPLLVLVTLTAMADGYAGWFLRRTGGERESGFIYHRAKRSLAWSFLFLWAIYLIPPIPMDPKYLIPPFLLAAGIATRLHVAFFKKYL